MMPKVTRDVAMPTENRLRHQQLVEIRIEHGAHDRVDLPGVVVDPGRDVRPFGNPVGSERPTIAKLDGVGRGRSFAKRRPFLVRREGTLV